MPASTRDGDTEVDGVEGLAGEASAPVLELLGAEEVLVDLDPAALDATVEAGADDAAATIEEEEEEEEEDDEEALEEEEEEDDDEDEDDGAE